MPVNLTWIGSAANGSVARVPTLESAAPGWIWSNDRPESSASLFSCRITSGVSSWLGIASVNLKMLAARTAGSAFVNAVDLFWSICVCTAAVCFFRSAAVERFGEIRTK